MDEARVKRLRERIDKLDRLGSDRNPNEHERAAAQDAAAKLRQKLPPEPSFSTRVTRKLQENQGIYWKQHRAPARKSVKEQTEDRVNYLNSILQRLKPSGQLFAADLCAQWYANGWLSERQLQCIDQLINEAEGN